MSDRELLALGQHVREQEDHLLAELDSSEATRRHLAEYVAQRRRQPHAPPDRSVAERWRQRFLGFSLAAAVGLAFWFTEGAEFWRPALTFHVGSAERSGVLQALEAGPSGGRLPIRFSDGTVVNLESEARARVVAVGSAGAEIVLESGRAELDVVPVRGRAATRRPWRVSGGPFSVEVKGTRFAVAWDPTTDDFALDLFEGSVLVKGCGRDLGQTIAAGQAVRASCARHEWSVVSLDEAASSPHPVAGALAAPASAAAALPTDGADAGAADRSGASQRPHGRELGRAAARAGGERPGRSWQELGRAGHFKAAFERASSRGFAEECARISAGDLMLLGDAARLSGDPEAARQAYSVLRHRFPSNDAAARAAFALGRLSVDDEPRAAAHWFDIYLREQPHGTLAQAALERLLELTSQLDDREWQREVAKAYLERYPTGPHARDAAVILEHAASKP